MEPQEVQTAIRAVRSGDTQSFGILYDTYVSAIYRFVYYKTHHKETAEDVTSLVFTKALQSIAQYKPEKGAFVSWLYQIARNTIIDHYRSSSSPSVQIEDAWDIASKDDLSAETDFALLDGRVKEYLSTLPSEQRDIILMRVWQEMSYQEIAEVLGKSEASCKMAYMRAIKKMRDALPTTDFLLFLLCIHTVL